MLRGLRLHNACAALWRGSAAAPPRQLLYSAAYGTSTALHQQSTELTTQDLPVSDPEVHEFRLSDGRIVGYTDEGKAGNAVFIGLHGGPGSSRDWRYLGPHLKADARFIRLEFPGFGKTPLSSASTVNPASYSEVVARFLQEYPMEEPVFVCGHSWGGGVALRLAATHPELVTGLCLLSSVGLRIHRAVKPHSVVTALSKAVELEVGRRVFGPPLHYIYTNLFGFPKRVTHEEIFTAIKMAQSIDYEGNHGHVEAVVAAKMPTFLSYAYDDQLIETSVFKELRDALHLHGSVGERGHCVELKFKTGGHNIQKFKAQELGEEMLKWKDQVIKLQGKE